MSVVANIVIVAGVGDWVDEDYVRADESMRSIHRVNQWLSAHNQVCMRRIDQHASGRKCMEVELHATATNHLDNDAFLAFVKSLRWAEETVMVFTPQEGRPIVWRLGEGCYPE